MIMVGEIRDEETADIAIQAALTGHLVFSTLHTNDAPSAITRLINMGVEPFLIGAALNVVLAQRLVRRICPSAGSNTTQAERAKCTRDRRVPSGIHCSEARAAPTAGRRVIARGIGVYEFLPMTEELRSLTLRKASGRRAAAARHRRGNDDPPPGRLGQVLRGSHDDRRSAASDPWGRRVVRQTPGVGGSFKPGPSAFARQTAFKCPRSIGSSEPLDRLGVAGPASAAPTSAPAEASSTRSAGLPATVQRAL